MSSHADTIRSYVENQAPVPNQIDAVGALEALLAENQRLRDERQDLVGTARDRIDGLNEENEQLEAENQRLREALERIQHVPYSVIGDAESDLQAVKEIAREALADDAK